MKWLYAWSGSFISNIESKFVDVSWSLNSLTFLSENIRLSTTFDVVELLLLYIVWNVPKWSARSVIMIPDMDDLFILFLYIWSINVVDEFEILVGLWIRGMKPWANILSIKRLVLSWVLNLSRSMLKSPIKMQSFFSLFIMSSRSERVDINMSMSVLQLWC